MARLEIHLFGPPEVRVDGRPLEVDTRKAIAILAVLAADGRPYARDELAALLWPDSDDAAARGALRRTLSTMRTAIGDEPLIIDRSRVDLDRKRVRVDLATVEAAARGGDRRALAAAAELARGEFLAGFTLRDSPEFDDWRATRAVSAERSILAVLDRLAAAAEADGDLTAAIAAMSRRLEVDALDESAHLRLMDLLVASGDRGGALRQYRTCVATLERELGVAPLAATTARYEAIRDAEPSGPPVVVGPTSPMPPLDVRDRRLPLVGRAHEIAETLAAHASVGTDGGRVLAVVGEAGIGKTRLLDEVGAALRSRGAVVIEATAFPSERSIAYGPVVDLLRAAIERADGPARLAGLDTPTVSELARLLPAIDPGRSTPASGDGAGAHARLVGAIVAGLSALVAGPIPGVIRLDDVQWLDPATREAIDALANRLDRHGVLLVLAWRAEDLDADGTAFTSRLMDRSTSRILALERLGRAEISALVTAAAVAEAPQPDRIERLFVASEGLPLYVAAVLATDGGWPPDALPAGVRSVLRERLASVGETTGQVLAAASVIGRSFDLETVRHVSGRSMEETVEALEEALRRGIVREAPAGYDFSHGALRDLAYEGATLTRRRHLHRRAAEAYRLDLARSGRDDLGRLVLVAVHERAAGRDHEAAEAYVAAGRRAASLFANTEAIEQLSAALALGHADAVGLHVEIGRLRTRLGDYAGAIAALEAAASAIDPGDDRLAAVEWSLARAHLRRGDLAAADHHLAAAASSAPLDDAALRAGIAVDRSVLARRCDDGLGAAAAATEALALAGRDGDPTAVGAAHRMLGLAALDDGDVTRAVAELRAAAAAAADDPDPTAAIAALAALAMAMAASGRVDEAVTHAEAAIEVCRRIGDRHLEGAVENHLADLLHEAGRDAEARPHQLRATEAFAEVGGDPADPDPGIWMLSAS